MAESVTVKVPKPMSAAQAARRDYEIARARRRYGHALERLAAAQQAVDQRAAELSAVMAAGGIDA